MDTIFALATVPGRAGVAIVRVSGSKSAEVGRVFCQTVPRSRGLRTLIDPETNELIDKAFVLWFDAGKSFTGEQVIEFHLHGSLAITSRVLNSLSKIEGVRLAEAGEFTRRALDNGKLDLAEVEGLADLIDAETESQHRQAIRVFSGELGRLAESWRTRLVKAAALIEASIDFTDEDVPEDVVPEVRQLIDDLILEFDAQIEGYRASERIRDGFEVAIVGRPNVGKSTLLNHLAGRDAALTSEIPGTTRDIIEVRMNIGGHAVTLLDTAGVRNTEDKIERLGVELAKARAKNADLRIFLVERGLEPVFEPLSNDLIFIAKGDIENADGATVSGKTGAGVDVMISMISERLDGLVSGAGLAIRERHRTALMESSSCLTQARVSLVDGVGYDLIAADLRFALSKVASIVGHVDVEDLLDDIFSSFCIGK